MKLRSALALVALFVVGVAAACGGGGEKQHDATFGGATQPTPNATTGKNSSGVKPPTTRATTGG